MITATCIVVTLLYLLSSCGYLFHLIFAHTRSGKKTGQLAFIFFGTATLLSTGLFIFHLTRNPLALTVNAGDFYLSTAWAVAVGLLFFLRQKRFSGAGAFFVPLVLLLFLAADVKRKDVYLGSIGEQSPWVLIHIVLMSLTLAVFVVSFVMGLLYLLQQFWLKSRRPGGMLLLLPSLEAVDRIHYRALTVGFGLLSAGILSGAALSKVLEGKFFGHDTRQWVTIVVWILYAIFLNIRLKVGWQGRRGILLSLLGFVGVVLAFVALEHKI